MRIGLSQSIRDTHITHIFTLHLLTGHSQGTSVCFELISIQFIRALISSETGPFSLSVTVCPKFSPNSHLHSYVSHPYSSESHLHSSVYSVFQISTHLSISFTLLSISSPYALPSPHLSIILTTHLNTPQHLIPLHFSASHFHTPLHIIPHFSASHSHIPQHLIFTLLSILYPSLSISSLGSSASHLQSPESHLYTPQHLNSTFLSISSPILSIPQSQNGAATDILQYISGPLRSR